MLHNKPITLVVSNRKDFDLAVCMLYLLVILAALLSPFPVLLTVVASLLFGAERTVHTLLFTKTNNEELISVIFPDGRVRLESDREETIEVFLDGQQWCTRWLTVLRVTEGDTTHKLAIRSAQQQGTDDYRRLKMRLRNDLCTKTTARQVLDS